MKQPIKMTPGDDLHLSLLMAPHNLNLAVGQFRQQLLGYGRAAFEAGKAGQCLHQIQEPAPVQTNEVTPIVVPDDMPSTAANTKYGESYGVDWVYAGKKPAPVLAAPAAVAARQLEPKPAFYTAIAEHDGEWIPLPEYSSQTSDGVLQRVLERAHAEGYRGGNALERLKELGWAYRPVYFAVDPAQVAPLPLLVRDIAREIGITGLEACAALKPMGNFSVNMAVTAEMAAKLRECFPEPMAAPVVLPEPDFRLKWHNGDARYTVNKPDIGDTDCYTSDTVRALLGNDAPAGTGGWKIYAATLERERDYWRDRAQTMHEHQKGECWYWQGDGNDNLESMVNSLAVVIRADVLRALLAGVSAPAAVAAEVLGWVHKRNGKIGNHFYTYEPHCDTSVRDDGGEKIAVIAASVAAPQAQADARDADDMYYLQDARWSAMVGNCPSWWRPDGNGYTTNLDEAARFTFDEAMAQHRCRDTDLPWLCSEVDKLRRPTVDCQYMPRSWDAQRESIAAIAAAKGE